MEETSTSAADRWISRPGGNNGFFGDLSFSGPRAKGSFTVACALSLLESYVSLADFASLDALRVFIAFEISAHLANCLMATRALISLLAKHAQEAEDREMALQGHLDVALTRVEELEGELKGPLPLDE